MAAFDSEFERHMRDYDTEFDSDETTLPGVTSDPDTTTASSYQLESSSTGEEYYNLSSTEDEGGVEIIPRKKWGAILPVKREEIEEMDHPIIYISFHYNSNIEPCRSIEECTERMKTLQKHHMEEKGLADIGYNFLVGGDLRVYEGRGWFVKPDRSLRFPQLHESRLDIAWIGDFRDCVLPMPMLDKAIDLVRFGVGLGLVSNEFECVGLTDVEPKDDSYGNEHETEGEARRRRRRKPKRGGRGRGRGRGRSEGWLEKRNKPLPDRARLDF